MLGDIENIEHFKLSDDISYNPSMSDLYHEIARTNYNEYKSNHENLTEVANNLFGKLYNSFNLIGSELSTDSSFIKEFEQNYNHLNEGSITDTIIAHEKESKLNIEFMISEIAKRGLYGRLGLPIVADDFYLQGLEVFKSGVKAIAFEAFACEAFLNIELRNHYEKEQIESYRKHFKNIKMPMYIDKFDRLANLRGLNNLDVGIKNELKELMRIRNRIAHFNGFSMNQINMYRSFEQLVSKGKIENIYICEDFRILDNPLDVYTQLKELFKV